MIYLYWFIACAVLILIELLTTSLIFASFAFGAAVAGLIGLLGGDYLATGFTFSIASVLAVFLLRPMLAKRFVTKNSQSSTNVLALIGTQALVVAPVNATGGQVKIKGEVWSARTVGPEIAAGQNAKITDLDGATLLVTQNNN